MRIRPTIVADIPALRTIVDRTGLFPSEMLSEMLSGFLGDDECAEHWLTCEVDGVAAGLCYAAPEALTEGTWNMLAIAVDPSAQGRGLGRAMTEHLEGALRREGQRLLIVDTSGTAAFDRTRKFYRDNGYNEEARIRDYWAPGDDKVVFWKSLL